MLPGLRSCACVLLAFTGCGPGCAAQQPAYPIEARLVSTLDARVLKVGDQVLFTSTREWKDGVCHLAQGATLHGQVVAAAFGHGVKHENFALAFTYPCSEIETFPIRWIALLAPDPDLMKGVHDNPGNVRALRSESFGEGTSAPSTSSQTARDPSGRGNPSVPLFADDGEIDLAIKRPVQVHTGDVWQIPRVRLQVAAGPQQSTIASSTSGRLRLVSGTVFVLSVGQALPAAQIAQATAPSRLPSRQKPEPAIPELPIPELPIPELRRCVAPACSLTHRSPVGAARLAWALPLDHTGYHQLTRAELPALDYRAAVAFLGPDQLLLVFDPHRLIQRSALDRLEDHPHMMRAVLFDLAGGKVLKTLDWRVSDDRQVLWQTSDGHVILHQGNALRWYGPGLVEDKQLVLSGPLDFFRASPDGRHFAVGLFRELHNPGEHQRLMQANANGPEEQVEVRLLDARLQQIFSGRQSSRAFAPMLLNHGSVELRISRGDQFYLKERAWDGSHFTSFASIASTCIPHASALLSNMIVVEACPSARIEHRILVLREDGSPVLDTSSSMDHFPPLAIAGSDAFALSMLQGGAEYRRNEAFKAESLAAESVNVYRSADGRLMVSEKLNHPLASNQPVSLSPDGSTMAVLDGDQLLGYTVAEGTHRVPSVQTGQQ